MRKILHRHHKIPKHWGGTDHKDNIEILTIEEHALAHKKLWEEYGKRGDYIAWKMLSGLMSKAEFDNEMALLLKEKQREAGKKVGGAKSPEAYKKAWETRRKNGYDEPWNKNLTKEEHLGLMKLSIINKELRKEGRLSNIGDIVRGKKISEEQRKKLSEKAKNRERRICEYCNKSITPAMYARWHGNKCKEYIKTAGRKI